MRPIDRSPTSRTDLDSVLAKVGLTPQPTLRKPQSTVKCALNRSLQHASRRLTYSKVEISSANKGEL